MNENNFRHDTGERIAYYRKLAGLTQSALAEKINYSDKAISKWERGESLPDVFVIMRLSELFEITPNELLGVKENQPDTDSLAAELNKRKKIKHIMVTILSVLLVWFVVAVAFFICDLIINNFLGQNEKRIALMFLYAVPISFIVLTVFSAIWGRHWMQAASVSGILWGLVASFIVSMQSFGMLQKYSGAAYIAAAVFQVLIILWFLMRKLIRKKS